MAGTRGGTGPNRVDPQLLGQLVTKAFLPASPSLSQLASDLVGGFHGGSFVA